MTTTRHHVPSGASADTTADLPLQGRARARPVARVCRAAVRPWCWPTLGAEVIKVEHPGRGDDTRDWGMRIGKTETTYYNSMNRNKRSITVDLQSARGA
jgi:hypothetical protein